MRSAGLRSLFICILAVFLLGSGAGCDNPFDPLSTSDKIQGLSYIDFSATQERWDSDPELDGLVFTFNYYNEFGDSLTFHDKPHEIQIELWSEAEEGVPGGLLTTKTIEFSNSDDIVRIPIESYANVLPLPATADILGCLRVRIFPPEEYPQRELLSSLQCGQEFYIFEAEF